MNVKTMLDAVNSIDEALIDEYFLIEEKIIMKKAAIKKRFKWYAIAACVAVLLICLPVLFHMMNPSQMVDGFRKGIEYKIEDIRKLPAEHMGKLLVQKLDFSEDANIELYYNEGGSASNAEDWYSLLIGKTSLIEEETNGELLIYCLFDGRTIEEEKVDMVFTKKATEIIKIGGTEVHLARYNMNLRYEYWCYAVFAYDGIIYDVRTESDDPSYIFKVLDLLLTN